MRQQLWHIFLLSEILLVFPRAYILPRLTKASLGPSRVRERNYSNIWKQEKRISLITPAPAPDSHHLSCGASRISLPVCVPRFHAFTLRSTMAKFWTRLQKACIISLIPVDSTTSRKRDCEVLMVAGFCLGTDVLRINPQSWRCFLLSARWRFNEKRDTGRLVSGPCCFIGNHDSWYVDSDTSPFYRWTILHYIRGSRKILHDLVALIRRQSIEKQHTYQKYQYVLRIYIFTWLVHLDTFETLRTFKLDKNIHTTTLSHLIIGLENAGVWVLPWRWSEKGKQAKENWLT